MKWGGGGNGVSALQPALPAVGLGRGFASSRAPSVGLSPTTLFWGGSFLAQGRWLSSEAARREEALKTTSCSCVLRALPYRRKDGLRPSVRIWGGSQCPPALPFGGEDSSGGGGSHSPKPFVHKVNSEEEAEAAEDGAENDGDDFTCVTPQRAQGRQGVSPPPKSCRGCALPVEYPWGPAREEPALSSEGLCGVPCIRPRVQFSLLVKDASTGRWLRSWGSRKLSSRRSAEGSSTAVAYREPCSCSSCNGNRVAVTSILTPAAPKAPKLHLSCADVNGLLENGPEHALQAWWGGQGPIVAVVAVQALGQQLLHAEGGDGRCLPCGGQQRGVPPACTLPFVSHALPSRSRGVSPA